MNLFKFGRIVLHSGDEAHWKVECEALTNEDWICIAYLIVRNFKFSNVEGVPRGGLALAGRLSDFTMPGHGLLIVDDVFTTGNSMERQRNGRTAQGVVLFARNKTPDWITPIWSYGLGD